MDYHNSSSLILNNRHHKVNVLVPPIQKRGREFEPKDRILVSVTSGRYTLILVRPGAPKWPGFFTSVLSNINFIQYSKALIWTSCSALIIVYSQKIQLFFLNISNFIHNVNVIMSILIRLHQVWATEQLPTDIWSIWMPKHTSYWYMNQKR